MEFAIVDVFADAPLHGNPLAVVRGAEVLPDETLAAIAQEFNLSETTFVLPPSVPQAHWMLRSFTPAGAEVFGAGHNALGACWWLAANDEVQFHADAADVFQQIGTHILPVHFKRDKRGLISVTLTQAAPKFGAVVDSPSEIASALGLNVESIGKSNLPVQVVSTGTAHMLVPVANKETVDRLRPNPFRLKNVLANHGAQGCYVFSAGDSAEHHAYARFFNPTVGIVEDPATGSAAGPLAAYLTTRGWANSGSEFLVEQGTRMGRRSIIRARVSNETVSISGSAVLTARGQLLP